jgi:hypothetical protein
MTTVLNLAVTVWSILGVLFIAAADYRTKLAKLNK